MAADIKEITNRLIAGASDQKSFDGIVYIGEASKLLSIAKELDFFTVDSLPDEPTRESLLLMFDKLSRAIRISQAQRNSRHPIHEVIDHVVPLAGHFVHAVDIDRPETLRFNERQLFGAAIRLASAGVHNVCIAIFMAARFEYGKRRHAIHRQVGERIFHRIDVADVTRQIEDVCLAANKLSHQAEVTAVTFHDLDIVLDGIDVEVVRPACGMHGIDDSHRST